MPIEVFSYKMTHDTGFAPNPFGGLLTLATCKPMMRKYKKVGDWIAGFTSGAPLFKDKVGSEKLLYLMKVEKKISLHDYWHNPDYSNRKPSIQSTKIMEKIGDNIYKPLTGHPETISDYEQLPNLHHGIDKIARDIKGENVLIASEFYYFGASPLDLPEEFKPDLPIGQSGHGQPTRDESRAIRFINYIKTNYKTGIYDHPTKWFSNDDTWKSDENYIKP